MTEIAEEEALIIKIEEKDLPDAERDRDKEVKVTSDKPIPIILQDKERADNWAENLKLNLLEAKCLVYYLNKGEENLPDGFKRWMARERAKLARKWEKIHRFFHF